MQKRFAATIVVTILASTGAIFITNQAAAGLDPIELAKDKKSFVFAQSQKRFTPWGFNYDRDSAGRLLEDYWNDEWNKVEAHFAQMKKLGANVVRIHLQFGRFMTGADKPNAKALGRLTKLLQLAERSELYLDLTGLGCYHKQDVPAWYDLLTEKERWDAQARFWSAIAQTCAKSPAVFCYDLMNEPVVPGGKQDNWLGSAFGGKHYVQFISRERGQRERSEIATAWIKQLTAAIRKNDSSHLITVGLVDWSLNRKGLTSGFIPAKIADELDFLCVHLYPAKANLEADLETLAGFAAVGKPVIIEETFPLKCSIEDFDRFLLATRKNAQGWIGFYWGTPPAELRKSATLADALLLQWLDLFGKRTAEMVGNK